MTSLITAHILAISSQVKSGHQSGFVDPTSEKHISYDFLHICDLRLGQIHAFYITSVLENIEMQYILIKLVKTTQFFQDYDILSRLQWVRCHLLTRVPGMVIWGQHDLLGSYYDLPRSNFEGRVVVVRVVVRRAEGVTDLCSVRPYRVVRRRYWTVFCPSVQGRKKALLICVLSVRTGS